MAVDQGDVHAFWKERGKGADASHFGTTMLAEHRRYVEYVHHRELLFLQRWLGTLSRPRVLDQGCGTGRLALSLAPLVGELHGFDISDSLIELATNEAMRQGLEHLHFDVRSATDAPMLQELDAVLFSGVMTYFDDATVTSVLAQSWDALASGGLLYMRNNCASITRHQTSHFGGSLPCLYRLPQEYVELVRSSGSWEIVEEDYLFPPLCWPNLMYYHVLPKALRDTSPVRGVLDRWFRLEEATADLRLTSLQRLYPAILRAIRKPTCFRVLVARKV